MEIEMDFLKSKIFDKNYNAIKSGKYRYIINEGGARSSKTFSLFQCYLLLCEHRERLAVWRLKRTWTKATVYDDFINYVKSLGVYDKSNSNATDLTYRFGNGSIEFMGMDDYQKIHGFASDYSWLNEAMEAKKEDFEQIDMRTRKMILFDYNPTEEIHFIYDLKKLPETLVIKSTVLDNPFIEPAIRRKILGYKPTEANITRGTADNYKWKVYGLGEISKKEGLIFTYEMIPEWPKEAKFLGYGLDFGYHPDPAAGGKIGLYDGRLVIDELFYKNYLTYINIGDNKDSIENELIENDVTNQMIVADSAAKTGIKELRSKGFYIKESLKYAGSVKDGIKLMKNYQPFLITERSVNTIKELDNYTWRKDIRNDVFLNEPIDDYNHIIDLSRYVLQKTQTQQSRGMRRAN